MRVEGPGKEKVITIVLPHVVFALQSDALIFGVQILNLLALYSSFMQMLLLKCVRQIFLFSIYLLDIMNT